jgi:hypothetical protein
MRAAVLEAAGEPLSLCDVVEIEATNVIDPAAVDVASRAIELTGGGSERLTMPQPTRTTERFGRRAARRRRPKLSAGLERARRGDHMDHAGLIPPILALVLWTLVVWVWMYATRIPAMQRAQLDPQAAARTRTLSLPPEVMWVSDNYNHLMEQPTIFYATAIAAQLAGQADATSIGLAWAYVALRVVHSLIQGTVNIVMLRFAVFTLSTLVLAALAIRTAWAVF